MLRVAKGKDVGTVEVLRQDPIGGKLLWCGSCGWSGECSVATSRETRSEETEHREHSNDISLQTQEDEVAGELAP